MNPKETQQVVARDEKWVPSAERVKISSTNLRLETTVLQKEETLQVVIDIIKNFTCFKAFTISADVPEINMQHFWYTIKKKDLDICLRVEGEEFTKIQNDDDTLTFLIDLGYKGPLHKYTNMYVDHMSQPWRTLAAIINKCLSGKTASNDKLRKSKIDIMWGMFYRENVDYPELICEDFACQIDHRRERKSRREREDYQEYGLVIPDIPPKKSRGKGSQGKKTIDDSQEIVDVSEESKPEHELVKKKIVNVALELGKSISLAKAEEEKAAKQVHATNARILTESAKKKTGSRSSRSVVIQDTPCATKKPSVDSQVLEAQVKELVGYQGFPMSPQSSLLPQVKELWGLEQESEYFEEDQLDDKGKDDKKGDADDKGDDHISDTRDTDDEDDETESNEDEIYKYKICVRKDEDEEMLNSEVEDFGKGDAEMFDVIKADAEKTKEAKDDSKKAKLPQQALAYLYLQDTTDAEISSLLDIKIQSDVPHIQSLSVRKVLVFMISKPTVLTPVQETSLVEPVITLPLPSISTTPPTPQQTTTPIPPPPITTDAPIITSDVLESDALFAVQLRVTKLEKDVSELSKMDHFTKALSTLKSQVPTVVEQYLRSKIGDDLQKILQRHTADLIQKYSVKPDPESSKIRTSTINLEQEFEKSASEILKIKKSTIKSTNKAALKEYDQKSALY
ncbi:hypothetical protein Tco_0886583 [Tanacetum coccineum]